MRKKRIILGMKEKEGEEKGGREEELETKNFIKGFISLPLN